MAADDDERGQAPDPWDEIVADGLGEGGEISFSFEEATESSADGPKAESPADAGSGAEEAGSPAEDALIENWLSSGDGAMDAGAPEGGAANDGGSGSSRIDIGTGESGVSLYGEPAQEEIGSAVPSGDATEGGPEPGWPVASEESGAGDREEGAFPVVPTAADAADAAGGAAKPTRKPAKPAKRKAGGIGQLVGVVLGAFMAVPITLAILIYGLGKDPIGITKQMPESVAFLLPEKFRPGYRKPSAAKPAAAADAEPSALDNLPAATETAEPAPAEPAATDVAAEPVMPADPAPQDPEPVEPAPSDPVPGIDVVSVDVPSLDDLGAKPVAAAAEPPPLDTAALDEAVGEAAALCEALGAVDDTGSRAYTKLRTRWYRSLARVAEELVAVEHTAATSGRPLEGVPENVTALHGTIGGRESLMTELAALAPDWLAYAKRGSDGVVVPVTFESSRKVGPFWITRVSSAGADGAARDITVISRGEPAAVTGDAVVVTGVALEGAVIWAADVRPASGGLSVGF